MAKEKGKMSVKKLGYIVLAAVILLAIAALILVPKYQAHLRDKRAKEVKTALDAVRAGVDKYWKESGSISGIRVDSVVKEAGIKPKVTDNWQFVIAWKPAEIYTSEMVEKLKGVETNKLVYVSPYKMVMAVAKSGNPVGEGTKVWFIGDTNSYHGFGIDDEVEPDWAGILPEP
jgi:type II secretory pathway pseudopilin PulG